MPDRQLCVARELTKKFEEFRRGTAAELLAHYEAHPPKGEIVAGDSACSDVRHNAFPLVKALICVNLRGFSPGSSPPSSVWLTQLSKQVADNIASPKVTRSMWICSRAKPARRPLLASADARRRRQNHPRQSAVAGATVTGEVVEQRKDKKVIAFKYRRRKGYHRTVGHRRKLTRVKITGISLGGDSKSKKAEDAKTISLTSHGS